MIVQTRLLLDKTSSMTAERSESWEKRSAPGSWGEERPVLSKCQPLCRAQTPMPLGELEQASRTHCFRSKLPKSSHFLSSHPELEVLRLVEKSWRVVPPSVLSMLASLDQEQDWSWKLRSNHENWGGCHSPFHKVDLALRHAPANPNEATNFLGHHHCVRLPCRNCPRSQVAPSHPLPPSTLRYPSSCPASSSPRERDLG